MTGSDAAGTLVLVAGGSSFRTSELFGVE